MLRVTQYLAWEELQELQPHWNNLLLRSTSDTIFLTWQWCEAWWKNYGQQRDLFVLAAWDEDEIVGIAPLYREHTRVYGKTWRRLRLIGDGSHDSDYLDLFADTGREAETTEAFAEFLEAHCRSWDWIELNGPLKDSRCMAEFVRSIGERSWRLKAEPVGCAVLPLPSNWEDYLRMLAPRFRTTVRSSLALLHASLKSVPKRCGSLREIDDWLPLLFDLHTRRWQSESLPGVFGDPAKRAFYRDLSGAAMQEGWLAFHRLDWAGRPLALQYGLIYRNRFHLLQEGYDPTFSSLRPGVALRAWLMRHWIEARLDAYDFLAGTAPHKLAWGAQEHSSLRILIAADRARAFMVLDLPNWRAQLRQKVASATPDAVMSLRKNIFSRTMHQHVHQSDSDPSVIRSSKGQQALCRLISKAYSSSLMGSVGRSIATKYVWRRAVGWSLPVRRPQPVIHIFQYHRVNDENDPFLGGLPVDAFRAQMRYLARNFPVLTLDQIVERRFARRHHYHVAVTFDDGYRDNFTCAFPILKQFGIPATIFLAAGYIGSEQMPWYDRVRLAFKLTTHSLFSMTDVGGPSGKLDNLASRVRTMEQTLSWLRRSADSERQSSVAAVCQNLGVPSDLNLPNQMLRWEDIRPMAKHNISFGAHTVTHPVLSRIPAYELKREVEGSKSMIENKLQLPVTHFAYPFGQLRDFNALAKQAVREAGFQTAVTTIWGLNQPGDDLLELKRFTPWETDPAEFQLKLDWFRFREPHSGKTEESKQVSASVIAGEARV